MAWQRRGVPTVEQLIMEELDPNRSRGTHMRVVFEEIIDLRDGVVRGYEVLTRVDAHPSMIISPDTWFRTARQLGVEAQVEARAVELAIDNLPTDKAMLSVNFSPDCLETPEVRKVLDRLAELSHVTVVELSEHNHVDAARLAYCLAHLRERGLLVAVDDAGTGQSGPEFVAAVRPDIIKIDRSLVSELHRSPSQRCFVHRYVELADDSNAMLVSEGVANARIANALNELGTEWGHDFLGQGYWLTATHSAS